ncbi:hypothetical protein V5799_016332 [Amblyomma americanum]|uniref:Uncharacterized protein n=1 Tax=Amblyomma americanum TaxID=6943 RepID=A0AAQ4F5G3_AMBAM
MGHAGGGGNAEQTAPRRCLRPLTGCPDGALHIAAVCATVTPPGATGRLRGAPRAYAVRVVAVAGHEAWPAAALAASSPPAAGEHTLSGVAVTTNGNAEAAAACGAAYAGLFTSVNPPVKQRGTLLHVSLYTLHMSPPAWCTGIDEIPVGREFSPLCAQETHPEQEAVTPQQQFLPRPGPSNSRGETLLHPELPLPPQFPWPPQGPPLPGGPTPPSRQEEIGPWGTGPGFQPRSGRLQLPGWPYVGEPVFAAIANPRRAVMMDDGTWYILVHPAFPENDECLARAVWPILGGRNSRGWRCTVTKPAAPADSSQQLGDRLAPSLLGF